jgi:hypothetical protein
MKSPFSPVFPKNIFSFEASIVKKKRASTDMSHSKFYHPHCLNCHYPLAEFDKFCPNCGQKPVPPKSTMHDLWHEFIHTFFHLDGKFFSTLSHLFLPGKLTEEYFKGHHKRYAHPIQLFLVLGGVFLLVMMSITSKSESKLQKQLDKQQTERRLRRTLAKMDSSVQQMAEYKNDPSVKKVVDSVLAKQLFDLENANKKVDTKRDLLRKEYAQNKQELRKQRLKIARFEQQFPSEILQNENKKVVKLLENYKLTYKQLETDSIEIVTNYGELEHLDSTKTVGSLETFIVGYEAGKGMSSEQDKGLKDIEAVVLSDIQNDVAYARDSSGHFAGMKEGFKRGWDQEGRDDRRKKMEVTYDPKKRLRRADSVSLLNMKVASNDILDLEADEIVEKYEVKGFMRQRFVKRSVLAMQEGGTMLHTFLSKFLWIIIFSLLPMAGFMHLLYWRQKRYFSEHLVWLLHLNSLTFVLSPLIWIADFFDSEAVTAAVLIPLFVITFIAPFIALKRYYKQSWGKTLVKSVIFQFGYVFIDIIAFTIGGFISFLFL